MPLQQLQEDEQLKLNQKDKLIQRLSNVISNKDSLIGVSTHKTFFASVKLKVPSDSALMHLQFNQKLGVVLIFPLVAVSAYGLTDSTDVLGKFC